MTRFYFRKTRTLSKIINLATINTQINEAKECIFLYFPNFAGIKFHR